MPSLRKVLIASEQSLVGASDGTNVVTAGAAPINDSGLGGFVNIPVNLAVSTVLSLPEFDSTPYRSITCFGTLQTPAVTTTTFALLVAVKDPSAAGYGTIPASGGLISNANSFFPVTGNGYPVMGICTWQPNVLGGGVVSLYSGRVGIPGSIPSAVPPGYTLRYSLLSQTAILASAATLTLRLWGELW